MLAAKILAKLNGFSKFANIFLCKNVALYSMLLHTNNITDYLKFCTVNHFTHIHSCIGNIFQQGKTRKAIKFVSVVMYFWQY